GSGSRSARKLSEAMGEAVGGEQARELVFDLVDHRGRIAVELDADALLAAGDHAGGGDPHHLAGEGDLVRLGVKVEQHEHLITQHEGLAGGDENTATLNER